MRRQTSRRALSTGNSRAIATSQSSDVTESTHQRQSDVLTGILVDPRTPSLSGTNRMRPLKVSLQYRRAGGARVAAAAHPVSRCRSWKEEDWPTWEPHLSRSTQVPRPRDFWDIAQLLPNKTIWLHGDSITLQMCDAAFCSLMRTGVAPAPLFGLPRQRPLWLRRAEADSTYNFLSTVLPNGAHHVLWHRPLPAG